MRPRLHRLVVVALATALSIPLSGCFSHYQPDAAVTAQNGATLHGFRDRDPDPLVDDMRVVISAVDGKGTGRNRYNWDEPVLVSPGSHTIILHAEHARRGTGIETQLTVEAGKSYVVRGQRDGGRVTLWLEEQGSGRPIGERHALCLTSYAPLLQLMDRCR